MNKLKQILQVMILKFKLAVQKVWKIIGNGIDVGAKYLNGTVSMKFVAHSGFRWGVLGFLALYVLVAIIVSWKVYAQKSESSNVRRALIVYPLPAVLTSRDNILVKDYLNQLKPIRHFAEKTKNPLPEEGELRKQLLGQMIETRLLLRAGQQYGFRVTRTDVDTAFTKIAEANGGAEEIHNLLRDLYGMTEAEFRQFIRDQLLREKLRQDVLVQVQPKIILLRDEAKARDILRQVKEDPSKFDELAKAHSEDTASAPKGGDLGIAGRGALDPELERVVFSLKKDEIAPDIVKSAVGWNIVRLSGRTGKVDKTYSQFIQGLKSKERIWILLR